MSFPVRQLRSGFIVLLLLLVISFAQRTQSKTLKSLEPHPPVISTVQLTDPNMTVDFPESNSQFEIAQQGNVLHIGWVETVVDLGQNEQGRLVGEESVFYRQYPGGATVRSEQLPLIQLIGTAVSAAGKVAIAYYTDTEIIVWYPHTNTYQHIDGGGDYFYPYDTPTESSTMNQAIYTSFGLHTSEMSMAHLLD